MKPILIMSTIAVISIISGCNSGSDGSTTEPNQNPASTTSTSQESFIYSVGGGAPIEYSGADQFDGTNIIQLISATHYVSQGNTQVALFTPSEQVSLVVQGTTSGTYLLDGSNNFAAYYVFANGVPVEMYSCSGAAQNMCINAGSSITIDNFGNVGEYISGSFNVKLCDSSVSVCVDLSGNFNSIRDPDA